MPPNGLLSTTPTLETLAIPVLLLAHHTIAGCQPEVILQAPQAGQAWDITTTRTVWRGVLIVNTVLLMMVCLHAFYGFTIG